MPTRAELDQIPKEKRTYENYYGHRFGNRVYLIEDIGKILSLFAEIKMLRRAFHILTFWRDPRYNTHLPRYSMTRHRRWLEYCNVLGAILGCQHENIRDFNGRKQCSYCGAPVSSFPLIEKIKEKIPISEDCK